MASAEIEQPNNKTMWHHQKDFKWLEVVVKFQSNLAVVISYCDEK